MVFSNSPSRVFCGALCSTYKTFCKTFLYDLVTKHCFLWDKTFEDSCATDIMPSTGIQAYGFNFIGSCTQQGFYISYDGRMCFKYFYSSTPLPKETVLANCQQYGAELLLLDTPQRRNYFLQTRTQSEANGHVGLSDIQEEGAWVWDNGCPLDGNTTMNMFDNEDDRYGCPAANCVAAVTQTGTLIFEDFCCDSIKHWYCAIHF
nr:CD209 antigen-like protein D [Crassostrea gigas]